MNKRKVFDVFFNNFTNDEQIKINKILEDTIPEAKSDVENRISEAIKHFNWAALKIVDTDPDLEAVKLDTKKTIKKVMIEKYRQSLANTIANKIKEAFNFDIVKIVHTETDKTSQREALIIDFERESGNATHAQIKLFD